jgi:hypothetical protein
LTPRTTIEDELESGGIDDEVEDEDSGEEIEGESESTALICC